MICEKALERHAERPGTRWGEWADDPSVLKTWQLPWLFIL